MPPIDFAAALLDAHMLLRSAMVTDAFHATAAESIRALVATSTQLYIAPQNIAECWNTITRPRDRNGYGFNPIQADAEVRRFENEFKLLEDSKAVYDEWRRITVSARVSGIKVHDARLAAIMRVHGLSHIATFNARDFVRYGVTPITPESLVQR